MIQFFPAGVSRNMHVLSNASRGLGVALAADHKATRQCGAARRVTLRAQPAGRDLSASIVAIATTGDRDAFAQLFEHFAPRVKSYLVRLGAGSDVAEELAQDTLLAVWRRAAAFDPSRAAASTWVFTIARNLRIDLARRERRPQGTDDPSRAAFDPAPPDLALSILQDEKRIARAIEVLPPEQSQVVRLAFYSDKPHSEIAAELGLPLGTVKSRLRLAVARLRAALGDAS